MNPGIHLMHKPVGPTSFSLVQACIKSARKRSPQKRPRICHGGTLDPFASGLLLMLAGPATRLFDHLHAIPKVYEATVQWGAETDNGDLHGCVTFAGDADAVTTRQLEEALASFVGWHDQTPPATSAKRIDGERAYLKAHRGEAVSMPPSRVYLHEARWLEHDLPRQSRLTMTVRGGFYVRSLARDIGRRIGCGAHLIQLHRSAIGPWEDPGPDRRIELKGLDLLPWLPVRVLSDDEAGALRRGQMIPTCEIQPPGWKLPHGFPGPVGLVRACHLQRFTHLLETDGPLLRPRISLGRGV